MEQTLIGTEEWRPIARRRPEDFPVDLTLGRSVCRPPMSALPTGLWRASARLRQRRERLPAGRRPAVSGRRRPGGRRRLSAVGRLLPDAHSVHRTALAALDPL